MITGKTESGFEFKLAEGIEDDWEFLKLIRKVNDDASFVIDVAQKLLGDEQLEKLEEHCKDENGKVAVSKINDEITSMLEKAGEEVKN